MPTPPGAFRVSVFWDKDEEKLHVNEILTKAKAGNIHEYQGVTDGWITRKDFGALKKQKYTVMVTGTTPPPRPVDIEQNLTSIPDLVSFPAPIAVPTLTQQGITVDKHQVARSNRKLGPNTILRRSKRNDKRLQQNLSELGAHVTDKDCSDINDMYLVRLKEVTRPEWRKELEDLGKITAYRPPNIFQMLLPANKVDEVQNLPYVSTVRVYGLADTITPDLLDVLNRSKTLGQPDTESDEMPVQGELASDSPSTSILEVVLHSSSDCKKIRTLLKKQPQVTIVACGGNIIRFNSPLDEKFIAQLGSRPEIKSISNYKQAMLLCDRARELCGIHAINAGAVEIGPWTGRGVVVGILDSGVDETHLDLKDQLEVTPQYVEGVVATTDLVGHGTHVAGIIAGTGRSSLGPMPGIASNAKGPLRGIPPEAKLVVVGVTDNQGALQIEKFADLGDLLKLATNHGATIINLSWGFSIGGSYDHGSASIDKFVYDNPEILVVVAAGNAGEEDAKGKLRFNTIGTPASAKNVLTVGASSTDRNETFFTVTYGAFRPAKFPLPEASTRPVAGNPDIPSAISSRGPTDFDSIKPDIMAPGTFILSTRLSLNKKGIPNNYFWKEFDEFNNSYAYLGGSSMAAPVVTGAAAIVKQFLAENKNMPKPSAALLKAILLASVKQMPAIKGGQLAKLIGYPDFDQGWGRVDLSTVLPHDAAPPDRVLLFVDVPNNAPNALQSRPPLGSPYSASYTYVVSVKKGATDDLKIVLAYTDYPGNFLQNNLQIEVRGPTKTYVGNQDHCYRKDADFDDKNDEGLVFDKHNNIEQVRIAKPKAGEYRIRVVAQNTPYPRQGYALCVSGQCETADQNLLHGG